MGDACPAFAFSCATRGGASSDDQDAYETPQSIVCHRPAPLALLLQSRRRVAGDAAAGRALYQQYCSICHGPQGKGKGPAAAAMPPKPRDHMDGPYMNAMSDAHLTSVTSEGGAAVQRSPLMPAWKESARRNLVLVNDVDIDPGARGRTDYGFSYRLHSRVLDLPPQNMLAAVLQA